MKIIHFSDSHIDFGANLGMVDPETRIPGRVLDCLDMVDSIIDFATDEDVDLIIFAGDAFHKYNPNPMYLNEFAKRVAKMKSICPVLLLVGNHDMSPVTSAVEIYNSIQVDNVIVGNDYRVHKIQTKSGVIQLATAPFPSRRILQGKDIFKAASDKIYELGNEITDEGPAILAGHFSVTGAIYGLGTDRGIMVQDGAIELSVLADPVWDYVALGHIHLHQCLNEAPPVIYAGSIDRVTFGEEHEDKGFVLIEIDDERNVKWEFIALDTRPYVTIELSTLKSDPTRRIINKIESADIKGAVVRVSIRAKEDYISTIDKSAIAEALEKAGIYILTSLVVYPIKTELDRTVRIDSSKFNINMDHMSLITGYLENVGMTDNEIKDLLPMAKNIITEVTNVDVK